MEYWKRHASVSLSVGKIAMRLLRRHILKNRKTRDQINDARFISEIAGSLKGPIIKVAQMLATIPDVVPEDFAKEFAKLQDQAPPMGGAFVFRRMINELGYNWKSKFKSFDMRAAAAASIGQVHQAISLDNEHLACKLQYPNMDAIIEADLSQLKFAMMIYEKYFGALFLDKVFKEISSRLREELDYSLEVNNILLYQKIFSDKNCVHIPKVFSELSTKRLLTMSWMKGNNLCVFLEKPQSFRNIIIEGLFKAWYEPFYNYAVLHGDPHQGNYTILENFSINLLDFGCIRKFSPSFIQGVLDLYKALKENKKDLAIHAYETWGFRNLSKEMVGVLNLWAGLLYDPLLDDRIRPIQENNRGIYGRNIAYRVHSELRRLGGVRPPSEFVFMDRAAVGVGSACMNLRAELNWHRLYERLIEGFNVEQVKTRQEEAFKY